MTNDEREVVAFLVETYLDSGHSIEIRDWSIRFCNDGWTLGCPKSSLSSDLMSIIEQTMKKESEQS